jgi:hypothetical protein
MWGVVFTACVVFFFFMKGGRCLSVMYLSDPAGFLLFFFSGRQWLQWLQWGVTFSQVVWLIGC